MWIETVVFYESFGVQYDDGDEKEYESAFWSKVMIDLSKITTFNATTVYTYKNEKIECVEIDNKRGSYKITYNQLKAIVLAKQEIKTRDKSTNDWLMANSMEVT